MNQLSLDKRVQIINLLVEGCSMLSVSRATGVSPKAIQRLLAQVGSFCIGFHNTRVKNIPAQRVQCDEIWQYVYAKDKNVPQDLRGTGVGDTWTWVAIDADTKLVISWLVGDRNMDSAKPFMLDLKSRLTNRIQLTTDGLLIYPEAVENAFGAKVDYAQLTKVYGMDPDKPRRYSPTKVTDTKKGAVTGFPDPDYISTSLVERQNLTMRMSMRRFTRLTNGFSKKLLYHRYSIALHFVYYNFCRIHSTIRVTPAMEAGLTKDIWEIEDLIKLADE